MPRERVATAENSERERDRVAIMGPLGVTYRAGRGGVVLPVIDQLMGRVMTKNVLSFSALAPTSDQSILSGARWGDSNQLRIDFSIVYMHANGAASVPVALDSSYDPDNDHVNVPVPAGGAIENETGYSCASGGDCHLIV